MSSSLLLLLYFQEMGIKDDFHQKSILICVDELCGRNPDTVSSFMSNGEKNIFFKKVSMARKYHKHTLQTNPRHGKEEPQNTNSHKT